VGPDFLDPSYLALASGRPCYNLDGWMTGKKYVVELFSRITNASDIAVIEGVMGLFDSAGPVSSQGSTAEIARWLNAPVVLVVDAHGIARSLAALVKGYVDFDPGLKIAGVIANNCGSDRHVRGLAQSLRAESLPPLLGALPRGELPSLSSRHLGLVTADDQNLPGTVLDQLADCLERHVSVESIAHLADDLPRVRGKERDLEGAFRSRRIRVGLARDKAFHFYYPDNLDELVTQGCELIEFSPIADDHLPEGIDGLYIGGGYPEEHAGTLAANQSMCEGIRRFAKAGHPVCAECGGLMYLSEGIETLDGRQHNLVGLLPAWTRMLDRRKSLGYVEVTLTRDSLWGSQGMTLRGHEFHYSELLDDPTRGSPWQSVYAVRRRRSKSIRNEGYQQGHTLVSYVHGHFASRPEMVKHFVATFREMS